MDTFELLEELMEKSPEEIQYGLLALMIKGKVNFIDLNKAYVAYLERTSQDMKDKLIESNCSILDLMIYCGKKETKSNHAAIHRALHNLNESRQFNMGSLNDKYGYDKEKDQELSWYWREQQRKKDFF